MQLLQLQSLEHGRGKGTGAFTAHFPGLLLFVLPWAEQMLSELKIDFLSSTALVQDEFLNL